MLVFHSSVRLPQSWLKRKPKARLSRGESCMTLLKSNLLWTTHSTTGRSSSVTQEPPASLTVTLKPQRSTCLQQLHRTAGTVRQRVVLQTRVIQKTSQRFPKTTPAWDILVREGTVTFANN